MVLGHPTKNGNENKTYKVVHESSKNYLKKLIHTFSN